MQVQSKAKESVSRYVSKVHLKLIKAMSLTHACGGMVWL